MNKHWKDIIQVELESVTKQRHEYVRMYPVNVEFQKTGGLHEVSPSEYVAIRIKRLCYVYMYIYGYITIILSYVCAQRLIIKACLKIQR